MKRNHFLFSVSLIGLLFVGCGEAYGVVKVQPSYMQETLENVKNMLKECSVFRTIRKHYKF